MDRIQTYRYFHSFRKVYCISVCHVYTEAFFQSRTSVGEAVLDYKILWFLSIYKWCNVCFLTCDNRLHAFHSKLLKVSCNLLTGTRCDLIDHGPWESNHFLITYIAYKSIIYKSCFLPFFCHGQHRLTKLRTILGTIVHRYKSDRIFACFISLIKHCHQNCHGTCGLIRAILDISLYKWEPGSVGFM